MSRSSRDYSTSLIIRELVFGRQEWVSFAIALHLRDFEQRFPAASHLRVCFVDTSSIAHCLREHYTVADIAIMRYGQNLASRGCLVARESIPQVFWIDTVEG